MPHRTNEDNQRDSQEEKELAKSMKNNKEKSFGFRNKRIKELEFINQSHKDLNGKLRTQLTFIKEYCEDEMKERTDTTDETADICKGRQEFAEGLLGQINKMNNNK